MHIDGSCRQYAKFYLGGMSIAKSTIGIAPALKRLAVSVLAGVAVMAGGCKGETGGQTQEDVLIQIGDSTLLLEDVVARIPVGVNPSDSAELFNTIVDSWIEGVLLTDMARNNISDMSRIERMTENYRSQLIVSEYLDRMAKTHTRGVSAERVRDYYEEHKDEMKLERPLVKGVYVKLPDDAARLDDVRRWIAMKNDKGIDNIERYGLEQALQYDYFGEKWVDWQILADQIPYRFYDPDSFLESTRDFETEYNGAVYLLRVDDYLPSGSMMPLEFAQTEIRELLDRRQASDYRKELVATLVSEARENGLLKDVGYDLASRKLRPTLKKR